ncbi:hypothetical protein RJG79_11850 [Mycoplasmatota bacterium WC44]
MKCLKCGDSNIQQGVCLTCETNLEEYIIDNLSNFSLKEILNFIFESGFGNDLSSVKAAINDLLINFEVEKNILNLLLTEEIIFKVKNLNSVEDAIRFVNLETSYYVTKFEINESFIKRLLMDLVESIKVNYKLADILTNNNSKNFEAKHEKKVVKNNSYSRSDKLRTGKVGITLVIVNLLFIVGVVSFLLLQDQGSERFDTGSQQVANVVEEQSNNSEDQLGSDEPNTEVSTGEDITSPSIILDTEDIYITYGESVMIPTCNVWDDTDKNIQCEMVGETEDLSPGTHQLTFIATDNSGNKAQETINIYVDVLYKIEANKLDTNLFFKTDDGGYVKEVDRLLFVKYDANNVKEWEFDLTSNLSDRYYPDNGFSDSEGGAVIWLSNNYERRFAVVRLNQNGELNWVSSLDSINSYFVECHNSNNGILCFDSSSDISGADGLQIINLDYNGEILWGQTILNDGRNMYNFGVVTKGDYIVLGLEEVTSDKIVKPVVLVLSADTGEIITRNDDSPHFYNILLTPGGKVLFENEDNSSSTSRTALFEYHINTNSFTKFIEYPRDGHVDNIYELRNGTMLVVGGKSEYSVNSWDAFYIHHVTEDGLVLNMFESHPLEDDTVPYYIEKQDGILIIVDGEQLFLSYDVVS